HAANQRGVERDSEATTGFPLDGGEDRAQAFDRLRRRGDTLGQPLESGRRRVARPREQGEQLRDRARGVTGLAQLALDSLAPDPVQLVERDEELGVAGRVEAA